MRVDEGQEPDEWDGQLAAVDERSAQSTTIVWSPEADWCAADSQRFDNLSAMRASCEPVGMDSSEGAPPDCGVSVTEPDAIIMGGPILSNVAEQSTQQMAVAWPSASEGAVAAKQSDVCSTTRASSEPLELDSSLGAPDVLGESVAERPERYLGGPTDATAICDVGGP